MPSRLLLNYLKSKAVRIALGLALAAVPAAAAPGAFELTASASCLTYSPIVSLSWTPSSGATHYEFLRDGQPFTLVKYVGPNPFFYDADVVVGGPSHSYVIRASDGGPVTTDSNTVTIAPITLLCAPAPPPSFTIIVKPFCIPGDALHAPTPGVYLNWRRVPYASTFDVYRDGKFLYKEQAYSDEDLYEFFELKPTSGGPAFTYSVVARNSVGTSTSSAVTLIVPSDICVTAPPGPAAGPFAASANEFCRNGAPAVHVQWSTASNAASYVVTRNGVAVSGALSSQTTSFDDDTVVVGELYGYIVLASSVFSTAAGDTYAGAGGFRVSAAVCAAPPRRRAATH